MDFTILHILENFREGSGSCLTKFILQFTEIGSFSTIIIILGAIYWCVSKNLGTFLLFGFNWCRLVNGFSKITACVYRPWITDPTIIPDKTALAGSTGYSFPSGHAMSASALFGGMGIYDSLAKPLRVVCWGVVALICFSRLYLSVHTPSDVIVGVLLGCTTMYCAYRVLPQVLCHKNWDIFVSIASIAVAIIIAIYATLKSYPIDYDSNGKLLVDGAKMAKDTFRAVGWSMGFFIGWVIERRYVNFSSDNLLSYRLFHFICGTTGLLFLNLSILPLLNQVIPGNAGVIIGSFLQMLYIVLLYPLIIKKMQSQTT